MAVRIRPAAPRLPSERGVSLRRERGRQHGGCNASAPQRQTRDAETPTALVAGDSMFIRWHDRSGCRAEPPDGHPRRLARGPGLTSNKAAFSDCLRVVLPPHALGSSRLPFRRS